jgi:hypothetical protein
MTIINDEFVTLTSGYTIRISAILAINPETGYIWIEEIGHMFVENPEETVMLHDHWIRVISARMGIHYFPAETLTEEHTHETR